MISFGLSTTVTAQNSTSDVFFPQRAGKVIQIDVVLCCVYGVPRQFDPAHVLFVAIPGNERELIGEVMLLHGSLHSAISKPIRVDRLQNEPALDEPAGSGTLKRDAGRAISGAVDSRSRPQSGKAGCSQPRSLICGYWHVSGNHTLRRIEKPALLLDCCRHTWPELQSCCQLLKEPSFIRIRIDFGIMRQVPSAN